VVIHDVTFRVHLHAVYESIVGDPEAEPGREVGSDEGHDPCRNTVDGVGSDDPHTAGVLPEVAVVPLGQL
jgi:hypothetical protein